MPTASRPSHRAALIAAGFALAASLLGGCFLRQDLSLDRPIAASSGDDRSKKNPPQDARPAANEASPPDSKQLAATRALLAASGWYREPAAGDGSDAALSGQAAPAAGNPLHFRWRHAGVEQLLARPAVARRDLPGLLGDGDYGVAATAAIALARRGNAGYAHLLIAVVDNDQLPIAARCAAAETLGRLPGKDRVDALSQLLDRHGQYAPDGASAYRAELHAELIRAVARHIDAGDDSRFAVAAEVPATEVKIETLRAWADSRHGMPPTPVVDLRSDDDPRVRSAALWALAARRHPQAIDYLTYALRDGDLSVRLTAVRGLGQFDDGRARGLLNDLLNDRAELIRAEAVATIAANGPEAVVLAAAADKSWRVRIKVAEALAAYTDDDARAAARRMLTDHSAEVEQQVVRSLADWPLATSMPVLFEALASNAISVRKLAAAQIAARWPAAGSFPNEAPPPRRAEALAELKSRWQQQSGARGAGAARNDEQPPEHNEPAAAGRGTADAADDEIERFLSLGDMAHLISLGPAAEDGLERLAIEHERTLPEPVYRDVLPRYDAAFAALDRLHGDGVDRRRQAAEELAALTKKQPLRPLAVARLCQQMTAETDSVVWLAALEAVRSDGSEPALRMARLALGQTASEVRLKGCEHLTAHPDPANEGFLLPLLSDPQKAVIVAAVHALSAAGQVKNTAAMESLLAAADEELQLEAAIALSRLHDPAAEDALRRLSYSPDIQIRGRLARALGELGDKRNLPLLVRLLDDKKATVSHAALASLPRLAGRDVAQSANAATLSTDQQIERWKKWYEEKEER